MNDETLEAIQKTVDYLDEQMEKNPSKDLAECSNYLQAILDEEAL